jgi:hypothetical protein
MLRRWVADPVETEETFGATADDPSAAAELLITGEQEVPVLSGSLTEGMSWQLVNGTSGSLGVVGKSLGRSG